MTRATETENIDSRADSNSGKIPTELLAESLPVFQVSSGAKRMSPEEQRRFFRISKNFFE